MSITQIFKNEWIRDVLQCHTWHCSTCIFALFTSFFSNILKNIFYANCNKKAQTTCTCYIQHLTYDFCKIGHTICIEILLVVCNLKTSTLMLIILDVHIINYNQNSKRKLDNMFYCSNYFCVWSLISNTSLTIFVRLFLLTTPFVFSMFLMVCNFND